MLQADGRSPLSARGWVCRRNVNLGVMTRPLCDGLQYPCPPGNSLTMAEAWLAAKRELY